MKQYFVVVQFKGTSGIVVLDFDTSKEAFYKLTELESDDSAFSEYGCINDAWMGSNMLWTCPVCDGFRYW